VDINKIFSQKKPSEEYWISISDLMAGLMIIFLFIAISYMMDVVSAAEEFQGVQDKLHEALVSEFESELKGWHAEIIDSTLSIRFNEPDVLFGQGKSDLKAKFKNILTDFYPRYIKILHQEEFRSNILEVRIEGHTSSEWRVFGKKLSSLEAFIRNMELSQNRTRNVLNFVSTLNGIQEYSEWLKQHIVSIGYSSSKLIYTSSGEENPNLSRRVEFRVITNAQAKLKEILSITKK